MSGWIYVKGVKYVCCDCMVGIRSVTKDCECGSVWVWMGNAADGNNGDGDTTGGGEEREIYGVAT